MVVYWYTNPFKRGVTAMKLPQTKNKRLALFALGALLGLAVFLLVYGPAPLDVTNDLFCRGGYLEKDIQQHYAGWLFYRQDALGFPLCVTTALNAPQGVSIAYTAAVRGICAGRGAAGVGQRAVPCQPGFV